MTFSQALNSNKFNQLKTVLIAMWLLSTIVVLIGLHGLFVTAEYATVRIARTEKLMFIHSPRSWRTEKVCSDIEEYLLVCQLGKTSTQLAIGVCLGWLISTNSSILVADQTQSWWSVSQMLLGFGCVVIITTVLGFELPKKLAINFPQRCAEGLSLYLLLCHALFWPFIWLIKRVCCLQKKSFN